MGQFINKLCWKVKHKAWNNNWSVKKIKQQILIFNIMWVQQPVARRLETLQLIWPKNNGVSLTVQNSSPSHRPEWKSSKVMFNIAVTRKHWSGGKIPSFIKKIVSEVHRINHHLRANYSNKSVSARSISFWTHPASRPTTTSTMAN